MCESSVWLRFPDGHEEKIADNVLIVTQEGDTVVLHWFLAEPRRVKGTILEVDAVRHIIALSTPGISVNPSEGSEATASKRRVERVHSHPHVHPH